MGSLSSGSYGPTADLGSDEQEALTLGALLGILVVNTLPDGRVIYTWCLDGRNEADAQAAAALLASLNGGL